MRTLFNAQSVSWISVLAMSVSIMGCQLETNLESSKAQKSHSSHGKVKVLMGAIHHPEDWISSAKIRIVKVQIRNVEGEHLSFLEEPFELSLTDLAAGLEPVMSRARVPDGEYDQIRLITEAEGSITLNDGSEHVLVVPSGEQTGIKVFMGPVRVENGVIQKVTVKVDLSQSFVARGQDVFHFKPVLHAEVDQYVDPNPDGGTETPPSDGSTSGDGSGNLPGDGTGGGDGDFPVIGS